MQRQHTFRLAGLLASWVAAAACAQGGDGAPQATGADRPQPASAHASTFDGYRPYTPDETLHDWRQVNDQAGRLGGHVGQLGGGKDGGGDRGTHPMPAGHHHGGHR